MRTIGKHQPKHERKPIAEPKSVNFGQSKPISKSINQREPKSEPVAKPIRECQPITERKPVAIAVNIGKCKPKSISKSEPIGKSISFN